MSIPWELMSRGERNDELHAAPDYVGDAKGPLAPVPSLGAPLDPGFSRLMDSRQESFRAYCERTGREVDAETRAEWARADREFMEMRAELAREDAAKRALITKGTAA